MQSNEQIIPIDERLNFYLNTAKGEKDIVLPAGIYQGSSRMYPEMKALFYYEKYRKSFLEWYCTYMIRRNPFRKLRSLPGFNEYRHLLTLSDFLTLFHDAPDLAQKSKYLIYHGEKELNDNLPYIRKARKEGDKHSVLFKLSTIRHFIPCKEAKREDIKWESKKNAAIWRGATTNSAYRNTFVAKYHRAHDIGFSNAKQSPELAHLIKSTVSIKKQLEYKFIVSLEGYDLASNLKWILISNSVPVMPKPTWDSWIMESKLIPYEHYLPLNDQLDNLEELLQWASENDDKCMQIALNGQAYMNQFFDEESEKKIQHKLLELYAQKFEFKSILE